MDQSLNQPWWIDVIKALVVINLVMAAFAYSTWLERKLLGRMQLRYGPNRAGPFGLLQPIADLVKLLRKESFFPANAIDLLYIAAPAVACFTALAAFSVIPFGGVWHVGDYDITGWVANVSIGLLLIFALGAIGIYAFLVGGWASESKYSLLGSMRTAAQLVSYEVSLALSVLGVVIMGQSLSLVDIVEKQQATMWFAAPQFVGLLVFFIAGIAETNRPPFDLPEAEQELVAGYHTEYSGMRFGLYSTAEYINMITLSGLAVTLFFGGWGGPWLPGPIWFLLKLGAFIFGPSAGRDPQCPRHRHPRGPRMSPQPFDSIKGFAVTFRQIFKKPITQQYPEYKRPVYPRFRGRHRLWRHENGLEKCVGCSLCAAACPADCIRVVADENTADNRVSPGERYARIYEINLSRCIFCGYCELACPFDAITLEAEYELSEYSRDDLIYTKDMLLAPPVKRMPVADRDLYDTPVSVWRKES
jgi:NADH-quinone oxidoreductase subunit H